MNLEEKKAAIENRQKHIDSLPYASTIPYPYCCACFGRLTPENIVEKDGELWDYCLDCKDK